ncbi:MAG: AI-2E family transporter [Lentisphaeria bacterium]|nr:AI-2E family transporter [Lentisphaeria bacterium]
MGWMNRFGIPQLKAAAESVWIRAEGDAHAELCRHFGALCRIVLAGDAPLTEQNFEAVRFVLRNRPAQEVSALIDAMHQAGDFQFAEAVETFRLLGPSDRQGLIRVVLELAISADRQGEVHELLRELAIALGMTEDSFSDLEKQLTEAGARRRKLLRSGAGIIAALIIILIFILTATLLRSVIFGLIGAYIMLPVEKFFERRLSSKGSLVSRVYGFCGIFTRPLAALAAKLQRGRRELTAEEKEQRERSTIITRAVFLTSLLVFVFAVAGTVFFTSLSSRYVHQWKSAHAAKVTAVEAAPGNADVRKDVVLQVFASASAYVETLRDRFGETPVVRSAIAAVSKLLTDENSRQEVMKFLLRRTGGMFAFTANVLGAFCSLLADILLTIFFFLLFLCKLAEFRSPEKKGGWQEEYLVRSVFRSAWLPGAGEGTLLEAQRILSEILTRLKIWIKGYLTLMLIDGTVYTTVFWLLDVPYFFILGPLAGCGILLPYIGPILSCCLTLLVALATGGAAASSGMLLGILAAYLIYNGIIEQFILYPLVIGESLGLTTLETIIVVLLGAIFAGIAGMLFAIPAASVLKYLVPQIYHCFDRRKDEHA